MQSENEKFIETPALKTFDWTFSDEELAEIAKRELGETPEKIEMGVAAMKESIQKHHIRSVNEDDEYLLKFLRVKKFRHVDSFKMLNDFTKSLRISYEKLGPVDFNKLKKVYETKKCGILPYRDSDGRAVMYFRFGFPRKEIPVEEDIKASMINFYTFMEQPISQIRGIDFIVDYKDISFREVTESIEGGVMFCQFMAKIPLRIHRIDVLNESNFFRIIYTALKPFVPKKIMDRVILHGKDREALLQYYHRAALPPEFGGTADGALSNEHWMTIAEAAVNRYFELQSRAMS